MKKLVTLLVLLLLMGMLAGCQPMRTRLLPVQNTIYGSPSMQNIERSIMSGASKMGWAVEAEPGVVYAAYRNSSKPYSAYEPRVERPEMDQNGEIQPYAAVAQPFYERNTELTEPFYTDERIIYVTISYNNNAYKINYADSKNMGFDPNSDSIYYMYGQLVDQLDRAIQAELTANY